MDRTSFPLLVFSSHLRDTACLNNISAFENSCPSAGCKLQGVCPSWLPNSLLQLETGWKFLFCSEYKHMCLPYSHKPTEDLFFSRGVGTLRICRHNSIINLLYHTFSQDNSNVHVEEKIWGVEEKIWRATRERPGNIYYLDF